jgi:hypothetical protein
MSDISDAAVVQYVIEHNGEQHSEHVYFVEAIKAALLLREQHPGSKIKVRDIADPHSEEVLSDRAA